MVTLGSGNYLRAKRNSPEMKENSSPHVFSTALKAILPSSLSDKITLENLQGK
jgi:hypothetical protein